MIQHTPLPELGSRAMPVQGSRPGRHLARDIGVWVSGLILALLVAIGAEVVQGYIDDASSHATFLTILKGVNRRYVLMETIALHLLAVSFGLWRRMDSLREEAQTSRFEDKLEHIAKTRYHARFDEAIRTLISAKMRDSEVLNRWLDIKLEAVGRMQRTFDFDGSITFYGHEVYKFVRSEFAVVRTSIEATWLVGMRGEKFYNDKKWRRQYGELNVGALQSGVRITRVFVFMKDHISEDEYGFLQEQMAIQNAHYSRYVAHVDDLNDNATTANFHDEAHNDFAIFDKQHISTWRPSAHSLDVAREVATWFVVPDTHGFKVVSELWRVLEAEMQPGQDCKRVGSIAQLDDWMSERGITIVKRPGAPDAG